MTMQDVGAPPSTTRASAPDGGQAIAARRVAVASGIGTTIEWYDFFIYGTAAAVVFAPQFFPQVSDVAGTLLAFGTFGIGFIARPLGGIVMGHFGDRIGRKSMLVWSLMLMGLSTFAIGLLPTYAQIGIWAPVLLTTLRFVQGFALGGEWAGAVLMAVEHAPAGRRGHYGSFVALGLPGGIILSNLVFLIASTAFAPEQFANDGWRLPFLASGVLVAVGLWVRLGIAESPMFAEVQQRQATRRTPIVDVIRRDAGTVALAAGSYVGISAVGYIVIVYYVSYATRQLGVSLPLTLTLLLVAAAANAVAIVAAGNRSDRFGRRRIMLWGAAALVVWSAAFFPLIDTGSVPLMAIALTVTLVVQGAYIGTQPALFAELFPTNIRFSGASMSLQLGAIVSGAPAPFIATALYQQRGDTLLITVYMVVMAVIALACTMRLMGRNTRALTN
jgi:metabolite-proton symporter